MGWGGFSVAALSFDDATGLETIGEQALQGNSQLTGVLDLSATNVSVIKKKRLFRLLQSDRSCSTKKR